MRLGHLSLRPSNHRIYNSSAMGDLRAPEEPSLFVDAADDTTASGDGGPEVEGRPETSSWTSVTTSPFDVISLLRMIRLWGNKPREVWMCCLTELLLWKGSSIALGLDRRRDTHSLIPDRMSSTTL